MAGHTRKHHKSAKVFGLNRFVMLIIVALGLLIVFALFYGAPSGRSVEVSFTDNSAHGMEIVPASCASAPPQAPSNGAGYDVVSGTNAGNISAVAGGSTYTFCVTNSSGNNYFLPVNSASEIQDFLNHPPSGVTNGAPSQYPY